MLGWTPEEFLARPFLDFVHPEDQAGTIVEVEKQVVRGEKVLHFENRYRHRDGSWRVLSWKSVPQPGGLKYATARDVTAGRRREEEIRQLNVDLKAQASQLEEANRELESFSYSVSHDLRAPLRHVQGYAEMLQKAAEGRLSEKASRYVKTIADASVEMGQLIDDLLAFSRMGRSDLSEGRVELGALVQETLRGLEFATSEQNIDWTIALLPPVIGDFAMLKQVLANLLGNAAKYTRHRDVAHIEVGCAGEEEGRSILFVRDNGAGFDMQYAHKLFGVFQRLHRAEEFEGTGIGLATVRRIIARHGGRVWAEGKLDHGATFYFTLKPATETGSLPNQPDP
jgi:light-regulated signal transduction histidine kinase (bacteriophytochrome)